MTRSAALASALTPPPTAGAPAEPADAMVAALGYLLGYDEAVHLHTRPDVRVARRWSQAEGPGHASEAPDWLRGIVAEPIGPSEVRWMASGDVDVVCVPVVVEDDVTGVLAFRGSALRTLGADAEPMLRAVASLLARETRVGTGGVEQDQVGPGLEAQDDAAGAADPAGVAPPAMALVDVFAFTVRVVDGAVEWQYFGPNSAAVFGQAVDRGATLPELIRRHTDRRDGRRADELMAAVTTGARAEVELRLVGADGASRWVSWRAAPRREGDQLFVDGVATDVSARRSLAGSRRELAEARLAHSQEVDVRREHARAVRDANDNVLQRLFASGLRLQTLQRRLGETDAHAVSAVAFQLEQAISDLREVILNLNGVIEAGAGPSEV